MSSARIRPRLAASGALLVAVLCVRGALADQSPPAQIVIKDFSFMPMTVTVKLGTTVTWANQDDEAHTVVSDSGLFRSSALDTGDTFRYRFDHPGTYHFVCSIHPQMVGTVVVN